MKEEPTSLVKRLLIGSVVISLVPIAIMIWLFVWMARDLLADGPGWLAAWLLTMAVQGSAAVWFLRRQGKRSRQERPVAVRFGVLHVPLFMPFEAVFTG